MVKVLSNLKVQEFSSPLVVTINKDASLDEALELMQEHGIRHLPVVEESKIEGLISERDLLMHIGKDWSTMMTIEDIMSTSLLSVHETDFLGDVVFQLSSEKKGSAIVLNEEGKLTGIFTTTDALNALVEILYPQTHYL